MRCWMIRRSSPVRAALSLGAGAAEIVGDTWRPAWGTWCRARDGHRCRSPLEKSIDDWFASRDVAHECEPYWSAHPALNPSGRKRADWLLADGTYVECAGMIDQPDYAAKITLKRELADELGIPLIVVGPTDLHSSKRSSKGTRPASPAALTRLGFCCPARCRRVSADCQCLWHPVAHRIQKSSSAQAA